MSLLDGVALANKDYIAEQYRRYQSNPQSVDEQWRLFFAGFELAADGGNGAAAAVTAEARPAPVIGVFDLVHSYRELGHLVAHLNPLAEKPAGHPLLEPSEFGFGDADLDRVVECANFRGCATASLRDLIARLQDTYCRTLGVEYMHIQDPAQRQWLQERMEPSSNRPDLAPDDRLRILDALMFSEGFEQFLQARYPTAKRFSLEGADALVPMLHTLIDDGGDLEVEEMVLGMAHRGRLNVLANVLRKPYEMILAEFEGALLAHEATGDGDVKYHLGYSRDHTTRTGRKVHLSLSPNPSHLEAIDPVIEGIVRAKQRRRDYDAREAVPVLIHGDAAFTGQGVVFETLWLSELAGYRTGGTVHVIVNNQIGFTTPPEAYRFTPYPSDVAKIIQAPIFHVNGDDPEAAVHAARLAIGFRQRFKKDVFIDLVCYRRHGHNELDDPTFTQPVMYRLLGEHPTPLTVYRRRLVADEVVSDAEVERRVGEFRDLLGDAQAYARDFMPRQQVFAFGGLWKGLGWAGDDWSADTRVPRATIEEVAAAFTRVPEGFSPHPKVGKLMEARAAMVREADGRIDWGCAEALAVGSLLLEGIPVRMTGQDTRRGTFSQRHAVLHDIETDAQWVPLNHIRADQAEFEILDSMLSENAVMGFELGLSFADPHQLICWEAQFGDFANGAQVIIDQFLASSESKWQRTSGLVLLLPHGYEGQGPEHSSARLERFLQLCAEDNLQVCNLTTPGQYFHALRRQVHRKFRKPLVIMTPKSLLRHKLAVSTLRELTDATFETVLDDVARGEAPEAGVRIARERVTRLLLSSGKIYYALLAGRRERQADTTALVRVEQLYPFPFKELSAILAAYPNAQQVCWVQEEPWNMGAWHFVYHRLRRILAEGQTLTYVGRPEAASPATGSYKIHQQEETELVNHAFASR
jgi:2-oxoglutarate dehydrogenase E1 component